MRHRRAAIAIAVHSLRLASCRCARAGSAAPAGQDRILSRARPWSNGWTAIAHKPEPARLPAAVRALSEAGALRDPEAAGFTSASSPACSAPIAARPSAWSSRCCRCRPATSGSWCAPSPIPACRPGRAMLATLAAGMPARRAMIDGYLTGRLPTLDAIELDKSPTLLEKLRLQLGGKPKVAGDHVRQQSGAARHALGPLFRDRRTTARSGA